MWGWGPNRKLLWDLNPRQSPHHLMALLMRREVTYRGPNVIIRLSDQDVDTQTTRGCCRNGAESQEQGPPMQALWHEPRSPVWPLSAIASPPWARLRGGHRPLHIDRKAEPKATELRPPDHHRPCLPRNFMPQPHARLGRGWEEMTPSVWVSSLPQPDAVVRAPPCPQVEPGDPFPCGWELEPTPS